MAKFVHLRTSSDYSIGESIARMKKLVAAAEKMSMPALALTDNSNLFASLGFAMECTKKGIQPIIGVRLQLAYIGSHRDPVLHQDTEDDYKFLSQSNYKMSEILLLAKNEEGYHNLVKLVNYASLHNLSHLYAIFQEDIKNKKQSLFKKYAPVTLNQLKKHKEGLLLLLSSEDSPIGYDNDMEHSDHFLRSAVKQFKEVFGDNLFVEIHNYNNDKQQYTMRISKIASEVEVPLVATNKVLFINKGDEHDLNTLHCISQGTKMEYLSAKERSKTAPYYFCSEEEMRNKLPDYQVSIDNSLLIAQKCSFLLEPTPVKMPSFFSDKELTKGKGATSLELEEFRRQASEGLEAKLQTIDKAKHKEYRKRLDFESAMIEKMGFAGYFLIVSDFVKWAKKQNIPVGPGRGSGAGSLIAWCLEITGIDPLEFDLIFERFLNPERISLPDFDIDFCKTRRGEIIKYVQDKYGIENVAQIITFGKLQSRMVVRDVARALEGFNKEEVEYHSSEDRDRQYRDEVDKLCKMLPNNPNHPVTLNDVVEFDQNLKDISSDS